MKKLRKPRASGTQSEGHKHGTEEQPEVVTFGAGQGEMRWEGESGLPGWGILRIRIKLQDWGRTLHQVPKHGTDGRPEFLAPRETGVPCSITSPEELLSAQPYLSQVASQLPLIQADNL